MLGWQTMYNFSSKKVIIIYSHKDAQYLERLLVHLAYYENKGLMEVWDDTKILPGTVRQEEFEKALLEAKIAILLISPDFLASKFILNFELPHLLDTSRAKGAIILSVILSPCAFEDTPLSDVQAAHNPLKPLSKMDRHGKEKVWADVANFAKNATMSQQDEAEIASTLDSNKEQYPVQNRFFPRFLYRDDSIVDDLLSQLENNAIVPNNTLNKFVRLYGKLTEQKMVQQLVSLDQSVYNDIQPGQIIEIRGKARLSLWEERADTITAIAGFSDWWKSVTGRDPWNAPDARQAYQGMTSLAAKKTEDIIIIVTPFNSPRFQFVAKLDARQVKCQKEELKTEV